MRPLLVLLAALALATASAQNEGPAERPMTALIPDVLSVRGVVDEVAFDLSEVAFPPPAFPARYPATSPEGGALELEVFASADGSWELQLQIDDLREPGSASVIPAQQILYRIDGLGPWIRADGTPQVIAAGSGATGGWRPLTIEFQLEVVGTEPAGSYAVAALISGLYRD